MHRECWPLRSDVICVKPSGTTIPTWVDTAFTWVGTALTWVGTALTWVGTVLTLVDTALTWICTVLTSTGTARTWVDTALTSTGTAISILIAIAKDLVHLARLELLPLHDDVRAQSRHIFETILKIPFKSRYILFK